MRWRFGLRGPLAHLSAFGSSLLKGSSLEHMCCRTSARGQMAVSSVVYRVSRKGKRVVGQVVVSGEGGLPLLAAARSRVASMPAASTDSRSST